MPYFLLSSRQQAPLTGVYYYKSPDGREMVGTEVVRAESPDEALQKSRFGDAQVVGEAGRLLYSSHPFGL